MHVIKLIFTGLTLSISIIVGGNAFAEHDCDILERDYRVACVDSTSSCSGLAKCQEQRRSCPQQTDEMASCEQLRLCMQDLHPSGTSDLQVCNYDWAFDFRHRGKVCKLSNPRLSLVSKDCPGYQNYESNEIKYTDSDFNCEGQKKRYVDRSKLCQQAYNSFKKSCKEASKFSPPEVCVAAKETINIEKVVAGDNNRAINNGPIDRLGHIDSFIDYNKYFTVSGNNTGVQSE